MFFIKNPNLNEYNAFRYLEYLYVSDYPTFNLTIFLYRILIQLRVLNKNKEGHLYP